MSEDLRAENERLRIAAQQEEIRRLKAEASR